MDSLDPISALARMPLLSHLTASTLLWLTEHVRERSFGAGDLIVRQGDRGDSLFLIGKGWVQIAVTWQGDAGFGDIVLHNLGPGQIFGEIAVLDSNPRSANAIALEPVICYEVSRETVFHLIGTSSDFARALLVFLAERVRGADSRVAVEARDPLTGLPNRGIFNDFYERIAASTQRQGGDLSVMLLDVDRLKHINDTYGHAAGDAVLRAVAQSLADSLRRMDLAVRYGGDEFALLLPGSNEEGAQHVITRVRSYLERAEGVPVPISVSFGIGTAHCRPNEAVPPLQDLLTRADKELYVEKERRHRAAE